MPKNPFQRPQPINPSRNVPRHGLQQHQPPKLQPKSQIEVRKPTLPSLEKLLNGDERR